MVRNRYVFSWTIFLSLFAAVLYHAVANVLNDYFDYLNGSDNINHVGLSLFTGGSKMIQNKIITPGEIYIFGALLLITGSMIGLYLTYERDIILLLIGAMGLFSSYYYTAPPIFFAGCGLGELL